MSAEYGVGWGAIHAKTRHGRIDVMDWARTTVLAKHCIKVIQLITVHHTYNVHIFNQTSSQTLCGHVI